MIIGNVRRIARLAGEAGFAALRHRPRRRIALAERGKAKATRARNGPSSLRHLAKRSLKQTFAMITVALDTDFAREARPKQTDSTLQLFLSTKEQNLQD